MAPSTTRISANTAAISTAVTRYRRQARSLRSLARSVDTVSLPIPVSGGAAHRSQAVTHLNAAAQHLDQVADRTSDFVRRLVWAEDFVRRHMPGLMSLVGSNGPDYYVLPEGEEAWAVKGKGAFLFAEAELGVTVAVTPLDNGKYRMTVVANSALGATAGIGAGFNAGDDYGASAEVALMLRASSGRIYEIDGDRFDEVLAYESAMALGHGAPEIAGRYIKVRPIAEFRSGGVSTSASVDILSTSKGGSAEVSKVVTIHRDRSVTTTYVMGGAIEASIKGVGPNGDLTGSLSITRNSNGEVIKVESVRSEGIALGGELERPLGSGADEDSKGSSNRRPKRSGVLSVSVDARKETTVGIDLHENPNLELQQKLAELAEHPVLNRTAILTLLHRSGTGEVVVTSTVNREGSFGGQIAAGAKLEVSGTISKSDEDVLSVTPVLPR